MATGSFVGDDAVGFACVASQGPGCAAVVVARVALAVVCNQVGHGRVVFIAVVAGGR